ncbi:MAG: hypothetical protein JXP34_25825 [Planctomycetes bacterium]|nr:hypothetical protein [Planctomycetota bacterium]
MAARSSMNIAIITLLSVLVLVLIGLFALQNSNLNENQKALEESRRTIGEKDKRIDGLLKQNQDFSKLLAGQSEGVDIGTARNSLGEASRTLAAALSKEAGAPAVVYENFLDFANDVNKAVTLLMRQVETADTQAQNRATEFSKMQEAHRKELEIRDTRYTEQSEKLAQAQNQVEELTAQLLEQRKEYTEKLNLKDEEILNIQLTMSTQVKTLEAQKANLQARLDEVQKEKSPEITFDEVAPDGTIVEVAEGYGFIDKGRRDNMQLGLEFEVFQVMKGGKRVPKGRVRVNEVQETMSRVLVLEERDSRNPIIREDRITSPFYDPEKKPVVVFAGTDLRTKSATREYVERKLKEYDVRIDDNVSAQTDFLVALKDYETDPKYQLARELKVVILREEELLRYLGL